MISKLLSLVNNEAELDIILLLLLTDTETDDTRFINIPVCSEGDSL